MPLTDTIKDPVTGKIKPVAIIAGGGVAVVGVMLLMSRNSSSSQAPASGTSAGISGDNTAAISDLQDAIKTLSDEVGNSNVPGPVGPIGPIGPAGPPASTAIKSLWGSDIPASIKALDPTGARASLAFKKSGMSYGSAINLPDLASLMQKRQIGSTGFRSITSGSNINAGTVSYIYQKIGV